MLLQESIYLLIGFLLVLSLIIYHWLFIIYNQWYCSFIYCTWSWLKILWVACLETKPSHWTLVALFMIFWKPLNGLSVAEIIQRCPDCLPFSFVTDHRAQIYMRLKIIKYGPDFFFKIRFNLAQNILYWNFLNWIKY